MTNVTAQMSVSLDGYYAGPRSPAGPHDMAAFMAGPEGPGFFRVTRWVIDAMAWRERQGYAGGEQSVSSQIIQETFAAAGAYVMGRRMFDGGAAGASSSTVACRKADTGGVGQVTGSRSAARHSEHS